MPQIQPDSRLRVFDETVCQLGEGPLWHPLLNAFFWFDILGKTLYMRQLDASQTRMWHFPVFVTAAHWINRDELLVASERELFRFNLIDNSSHAVTSLESENHDTRSNDGRGDPHGGFWISTMSIDAADNAGAIYRYFCGELRQLHTHITIPNGICFSPDGSTAYFSDSAQRVVFKQPLDNCGWPSAPADIFLDFTHDKSIPDGACTDCSGNIWIADWGGSRIIGYSPSGVYLKQVLFPVSQTTCPTFGGLELNRMIVTSASIGLTDAAAQTEVHAGITFSVEDLAQGWDCCPVFIESK